MKKLFMILILMFSLVGCGLFSKPTLDENIPTKPMPEHIIEIKHDVKKTVETIKDSPTVKSVKQEIVSTTKWDDFKLVEPKTVTELDTQVIEAEKVIAEREKQSQDKIQELTIVIQKNDDEDTKGFKALLRFIIYVSTIGFFVGIVLTYFSKHMIAVSIISAICIVLAFGMLKALAIIWIVGGVAVIAGLGGGIYYLVHYIQERKKTLDKPTQT